MPPLPQDQSDAGPPVRTSSRRTWCLVAVALVFGWVIGQSGWSRSSAAADPTACPPIAATPPSGNASPVAAAAGTEMTYLGGWAITVESAQVVPTPEDSEIDGRLVKVILKVVNGTADRMRPPYADFRLVTATADRLPVNPSATSRVGSDAFVLNVDAYGSARIELVFVDPNQSGDVFVLESTEDPTFRVALTLTAVRG